MGRYLDEIRLVRVDLKSDGREAGVPPARITKETNSTKEPLECRLSRHGLSIAIDRQTGDAVLIFSTSDAEIVKDVATVYHQPFELKLTAKQYRDLTDSLDYYEDLISRATNIPAKEQSVGPTGSGKQFAERRFGTQWHP